MVGKPLLIGATALLGALSLAGPSHAAGAPATKVGRGDLRSNGVALAYEGGTLDAKSVRNRKVWLHLDDLAETHAVRCKVGSKATIAVYEFMDTPSGPKYSGLKRSIVPKHSEISFAITPDKPGDYFYMLKGAKTKLISLDDCAITVGAAPTPHPAKRVSANPTPLPGPTKDTFSGRRSPQRRGPAMPAAIQSQLRPQATTTPLPAPAVAPTFYGYVPPDRLGRTGGRVQVSAASFSSWSSSGMVLPRNGAVQLKIASPPKGQVAVVRCGVDVDDASLGYAFTTNVGGKTKKHVLPKGGGVLEFSVPAKKGGHTAALQMKAAKNAPNGLTWTIQGCDCTVR